MDAPESYNTSSNGRAIPTQITHGNRLQMYTRRSWSRNITRETPLDHIKEGAFAPEPSTPPLENHVRTRLLQSKQLLPISQIDFTLALPFYAQNIVIHPALHLPSLEGSLRRYIKRTRYTVPPPRSRPRRTQQQLQLHRRPLRPLL